MSLYITKFYLRVKVVKYTNWTQNLVSISTNSYYHSLDIING